MMDHATKDGRPKILRVRSPSRPPLRLGDLLDRAWLDVTQDGLVLRELAPGETVDSVQALTDPRLIVAPDVRRCRSESSDVRSW